MKIRRECVILAAAAAGVGLTSLADVETVTSQAATFKFYGNPERVYSLVSAAELAAWPVTWRAGETVVATAMDGAETTLSDGTDATSASLPNKGGVWTLANSAEGSARIGVPWAVFDDGGAYGANATAGFVADMVQTGPDRKLKKSEVPPVAYSGDDWAGDLSKAATITFTPPEGSGLETTTWSRTGDGARAFTFNAKGDWTVTLAFADGTTKTATITIESAGFMLIVR
ncbi:MAG: hypothetical protein IJQ00_14285 [Kiritimatiellae bacterium]|nr:hypothetical protein [Kiritimatiellia bacterium]